MSWSVDNNIQVPAGGQTGVIKHQKIIYCCNYKVCFCDRSLHHYRGIELPWDICRAFNSFRHCNCDYTKVVDNNGDKARLANCDK